MAASQAMTIRLPEELHARLRWHAYDTGKPMSQLVIEALDAHLPGPEAIAAAMQDRATTAYREALTELAER